MQNINQSKNKSPLLRILSLSFDLPIYGRQVSQWRGAFIEMAGWQDDLFHNHNNSQELNGYFYRYPLIQYRCHKGNAGVFAINEGADVLQKCLASSDWKINWDGHERQLKIDEFQMNENYFRMLNQPKEYRLYKWLALNQKNYKRWQTCSNFTERIALLERVLGSNIISLFKGLNWRPEKRIEVNIQEFRNSKMINFHGQKILAFDIVYDANVLLPANIGIGKGVSLGFGQQIPKKERFRKRMMNIQTITSKTPKS